MTRFRHNLIVGALAAFLAGLTLFGSCVCGPTKIDAPVKGEATVEAKAEVKAEANVGSPHAELTVSPVTTVGRDIIAENANWIVAFAIGWPMLCVLAGFIIYMVSNRIPAVLAMKDRAKGLTKPASVRHKTGILDPVRHKGTPPPALPDMVVCPRCNAIFSPRLDGPPLSPEIDGD